MMPHSEINCTERPQQQRPLMGGKRGRVDEISEHEDREKYNWVSAAFPCSSLGMLCT